MSISTQEYCWLFVGNLVWFVSGEGAGVFKDLKARNREAGWGWFRRRNKIRIAGPITPPARYHELYEPEQRRSLDFRSICMVNAGTRVGWGFIKNVVVIPAHLAWQQGRQLTGALETRWQQNRFSRCIYGKAFCKIGGGAKALRRAMRFATYERMRLTMSVQDLFYLYPQMFPQTTRTSSRHLCEINVKPKCISGLWCSR